MKDVFKMPKPVKIIGKTSTITNSFVNGIIPVIKPTEQEITDALEALGMTEDTICCAYCGDKYTEWDHFHPLVKGKKPTGYISEIHNLVPACGKCNQSKGNKYWREWMFSNAPRSPKTRKIKDLEERAEILEGYEKKYPCVKVDFIKIVGEDRWNKHWDNCQRIHKLMAESQKNLDDIKKLLYQYVCEQGVTSE